MVTTAVANLSRIAFAWFLIEGLLLLLAGRQFLRTQRARRWWTLSVVIGTALIDVFGILLALTDRHFAVY